jgi:hypothetical protein
MGLTDEQKTFYQEMENTFNTPGWEYMKQGWAEEQSQIPLAVFFNAKSIDDVKAARVRYGLLDELLSLPETLTQQRENVEQGDEE